MNSQQYFEDMMALVTKDPSLVSHMRRAILSENQIFEIEHKALHTLNTHNKLNPYNQRTLNVELISTSPDQCFKAAEVLIEYNPQNIRLQRVLQLPHDEYNKVASQAVKKNGLTLQYIDNQKLSGEQYFAIALSAVKQSSTAFKFVNSQYLNEAQYHTITLEALKQGELIDHSTLDSSQYSELMIEASQYTPYIMRHIHFAYLDEDNNAETYFKIAMNTMQHPWSNQLEYLKLDRLTASQYNQIAFEAVKHHGSKLQSIHPKCLKDDQNFTVYQKIVLEALKQDGCHIQFAQLEYLGLKTHPNQYHQIASEAVSQNGYAIRYIDPHLLTSAEYSTLALKAVKQAGKALSLIKVQHLDLTNNPHRYHEIVRSAVIQNSVAIKDVQANKLHPDEYFEIVLEAVKQHHCPIKHIQLEWLNLDKHPDRYYQILLAAAKAENPVLANLEINKLSPEQYHAIALIAVAHDHHALYFVNTDHPGIEENPEDYYALAHKAVSTNGFAVKYVLPHRLNPNQYHQLAQLAVDHDGNTLQYLELDALDLTQYPDRYHHLAITAVTNNTLAFKTIDPAFLNDQEDCEIYFKLVQHAIEGSPHHFSNIKRKYLTSAQYAQIVTKSLKQHAPLVKYVDHGIKAFIENIKTVKAQHDGSESSTFMYLEAIKSDPVFYLGILQSLNLIGPYQTLGLFEFLSPRPVRDDLNTLHPTLQIPMNPLSSQTLFNIFVNKDSTDTRKFIFTPSPGSVCYLFACYLNFKELVTLLQLEQKQNPQGSKENRHTRFLETTENLFNHCLNPDEARAQIQYNN